MSLKMNLKERPYGRTDVDKMQLPFKTALFYFLLCFELALSCGALCCMALRCAAMSFCNFYYLYRAAFFSFFGLFFCRFVRLSYNMSQPVVGKLEYLRTYFGTHAAAYAAVSVNFCFHCFTSFNYNAKDIVSGFYNFIII